MHDPVLRALSMQGREVRLAVTVDASLEDQPLEHPPEPTPPSAHTPDSLRTERFASEQTGAAHTNGNPQRRRDPADTERTRLNPKYTFETFVAGASNRFAHAAASAVAEAPAKAFNPLFMYGPPGPARPTCCTPSANYARGRSPRPVRSPVTPANGSSTTSSTRSAPTDGRPSRSRYREDCDALLIDDIQFLAGKERTQDEFFHTFNSLYDAHKQIVLTSDLPPKGLTDFEGRLRSRFEWGLITDVQVPDLETRIAILRKKAIQERMNAPDEVLEYIATRITSNIRELEGGLIRVTAFASLNRNPVDLALAEAVLKDVVPNPDAVQITVGTIQGETANYYSLTVDDLCGASRTRQLVTARQIAMYLCRELTQMSLPKIGQAFGGRDHTTVMHADRKIRDLMRERRAIYNQVTEAAHLAYSPAKRLATDQAAGRTSPSSPPLSTGACGKVVHNCAIRWGDWPHAPRTQCGLPPSSPALAGYARPYPPGIPTLMSLVTCLDVGCPRCPQHR